MKRAALWSSVFAVIALYVATSRALPTSPGVLTKVIADTLYLPRDAGVLNPVLARDLYVAKDGGSIVSSPHAVDHLTFRMPADSQGFLKVNDFGFNSVPTTFAPTLEGRGGHNANSAMYFWGRAGDSYAAVPVFQFIATNSGAGGAPSTNALFGVDSWDKRKFTIDQSGQVHIGEGTAAITEMLRVTGNIRVSSGVVFQTHNVNPAGSTGCDAATEVGTIRYVNPLADGGYRACQCICTQTGSSTFAWSTISLNGACTASTDC